MIKLSVLDRVQQFLPQLAESNASLSGRDQRELDIENISDEDAYHIEMVRTLIPIFSFAYLSQNLGLGVFEYERRGARSDDVSSNSGSFSSMSERDSEESSGSSLGSSSCSEDDAQIAARPKKPLPRRAKKSITVLSELENLPGGSSA